MPQKLVFLKTEADFALFKKSRSIVSANFRMRWHAPRNQNHPRFGFIIPKKTVSKVTDRNLIKRRFKAVLQKHISKIKGVDILFFPTLKTVRVKFTDLEGELINTFKKAGLYANP